MTMNVEILKESFEALKPVAAEVVDHFYAVYFKDHPEVKPLFNLKKMHTQKKALIQSLVTIFDNIENNEKLVGYLKKLGGRHHQYGVTPEHYIGMGSSLLSTLQYFFDDTWTPELAESWTSAIQLISEVMIAGSQEKALASSNVLPMEKEIEENMKDEIEIVLRELMKESIFDLTKDSEVKEMIKEQAKALLKEALQDELSQLREKWKQQKSAA